MIFPKPTKATFWNLTHWGRVTHIFVGNITIIGLDNGLSPVGRQAIILANSGILSIGPLRTNVSEIVFDIHTILVKNMSLKISSVCKVLMDKNTGSFLLTQWPITWWRHDNNNKKRKKTEKLWPLIHRTVYCLQCSKIYWYSKPMLIWLLSTKVPSLRWNRW